ncbi:NADH dehydrogenase [ubiquinone] 1 beta subcomplex subunit 3 [Mycolicibacterium baixiangningiae]|nr:NADH dehydrogenase [ubiquinone] 1 beta subcomplex subunit 3 [Mycolicibacterium baixiangningiae]
MISVGTLPINDPLLRQVDLNYVWRYERTFSRLSFSSSD